METSRRILFIVARLYYSEKKDSRIRNRTENFKIVAKFSVLFHFSLLEKKDYIIDLGIHSEQNKHTGKLYSSKTYFYKLPVIKYNYNNFPPSKNYLGDPEK